MVRTLTAIGLACPCAWRMRSGWERQRRRTRGGDGVRASFPNVAAAADGWTGASSGGVVDLDKTIVQPDPNSGGGAPPGAAPMMAYTYGWNFAVPTGEMSNAARCAQEALRGRRPGEMLRHDAATSTASARKARAVICPCARLSLGARFREGRR